MDVNYLIKEAIYYRKLDGLPKAFKKFLLSQTPLSKIVNGPLYEALYQKKIKKVIKEISPTILQIENTNFCNAKCIMCPHTIMHRKGKVMNLINFKRILDDVMAAYKIKRLTITGFGEPFIDPSIIEKINYVNNRYPDLKIDIYTNASLLNPSLTERLLKTKIDKITFSVNGVSKNYKKIMGLNYGTTEKNILYFIKKKNKLKKQTLTNISLMTLGDNEKEIDEFMRFWKPLSDSVRVYAPSDWAGILKNIIQKIPFKNRRWPCFALWNNITVDVEGNVIMCCRDYESRVKFGNLFKQRIKEIRNSKRFKVILEKHLNLDFSCPICNKCDNSFDSSLDWWV